MENTLLAMTPVEADSLLNKLTIRAQQGKITPQEYSNSLFQAREGANSPDYIRRNIRNALNHPLSGLFIQNPDLARPFASQLGITQGGFGFGLDLLKQLKKDNLLRKDVTQQEITTEVQKPLYNALSRYLKINKDNPKVNTLIKQGMPFIRGPKGKTNLQLLLE